MRTRYVIDLEHAADLPTYKLESDLLETVQQAIKSEAGSGRRMIVHAVIQVDGWKAVPARAHSIYD